MRHFFIRQEELRRFLSDFDLPPVEIGWHGKNLEKPTVMGDYGPPGTIRIFLDAFPATASLRLHLDSINRTMLHELRHHWQFHKLPNPFDDKPGAYWGTAYETDAREFADEFVRDYRVVGLEASKSQPRRGFASLGRAKR